MKKLLTLIAAILVSHFSNAQNSTMNTPAAGIVSTDNFTYHGFTVSHYGLGWYADPAYTAPTAFLSSYFGIKFFSAGAPQAVLDVYGRFGVGTETPISNFQVDEGCTKASIGDASGSVLNYGTSYLGFNASRNGTTNWAVSSDGTHNGGGVVYSSVFGDIYFAPVPTLTGSSGQANRTLSDQNIADYISVKISHTNGALYAKQIYVTTATSSWPDFVFKKAYHLKPLSEVKAYIDLNQRLPEMPAAAEVEKDGINVGEMNKLLLKKVEELTLYLIEQNNALKEQAAVNATLQSKIGAIEKQLKDIKTITTKGN